MANDHSELVIDDVYARLREMVLMNVLHAGQKLVDRELAEQLGVSRTPIREALGRLAMTGLVDKRARRGYYVSKFSAEQVSDLYEFRKMLEINAVTLATRNAQPSHLDEFARILGELKELPPDPRHHARAVRLDLDIHELIGRASGNASLHQAMQNVLDKVMRFISVEIADRAALAAAYNEHLALFNLIREKNAAGAAELIRAHVDTAQRSLVQVFQAREELRNSVMATRPSGSGHTKRRKIHAEDQQGGSL